MRKRHGVSLPSASDRFDYFEVGHGIGNSRQQRHLRPCKCNIQQEGVAISGALLSAKTSVNPRSSTVHTLIHLSVTASDSNSPAMSAFSKRSTSVSFRPKARKSTLPYQTKRSSKTAYLCCKPLYTRIYKQPYTACLVSLYIIIII